MSDRDRGPSGYHLKPEVSDGKAREEEYLQAVAGAFPVEEGDAADRQFRVLLKGVAAYPSAHERAVAIEHLLSDIDSYAAMQDAGTKQFYEDMGVEDRTRLIEKLQAEHHRLDGIAALDKKAREKEGELDEVACLARLLSKDFIIEAPALRSRIDSRVTLVGGDYIYNMFGFKEGDCIQLDDGEWVMDGTWVKANDIAGATFVRPRIFEQMKDIMETMTGSAEQGAAVEALGDYERKELSQEELKELATASRT